jgi:hypothetical protein
MLGLLEEFVKYCPYCNSDKGLELKHISKYSDDCYSVNREDPNIYAHSGHMFVRECLSCHRLILSDDFGGELPASMCDKSRILYPNLIDSGNIPIEVRNRIEQARRIKSLNVDAFCLAIRKCIEIICKLNGIEKGSLFSKLERLCEIHTLPPLVMEAANHIRVLGNQAAHDLEDIHPINAEQIEEFLQVLIEYLYILPAKLRWFKHFQEGGFSNQTGLITKDGRWIFQKGKYVGYDPNK